MVSILAYESRRERLYGKPARDAGTGVGNIFSTDRKISNFYSRFPHVRSRT